MPSKSSDNDTERFARSVEMFACHAARLIADSRFENVQVLDLRGVSQVTDFFVIGTGTSDRQNASVADEVKLLGELEGQSLFRMSGHDNSEWMLLDFVDTVVHLFLPHLRGYYDLESLWGDARRVDWASQTRPGQFAKLSASRRSAG